MKGKRCGKVSSASIYIYMPLESFLRPVIGNVTRASVKVTYILARNVDTFSIAEGSKVMQS